jgi:hypothetical protein
MQYQKIKKFLECHYPIEIYGDNNLDVVFPTEIDMEYSDEEEIENMPASISEGTKLVAVIHSGTGHYSEGDDKIFLTPSGIGIWYDSLDGVWKTTTKKYAPKDLLKEIKKILISMAGYN